jgi:hypothetical protein
MLMNTKLHDLLAILIKEEKIYQEYSRLLFANRGVDKFGNRVITGDTQKRLHRLAGIAFRLESRRQNKVSEISKSFNEPDADERLRSLFENIAAPVIKGLDDLAGVINKMHKFADDCNLQSEILINHSHDILMGSSKSIRHHLMENRHIPQGEPAC